MAYAMTKQGSLDNCVTYEFICDTIDDMNSIENRYRTLGTVAIVLEGDGGLEVYIAGSNKEWNSMSAIGGGSSSGSGSSNAASGLSIHVCTQNEVRFGKPNISSPSSKVVYLVPASNATTGNLYDEYIYVNSKWEKFGGANVDLSQYVTQDTISNIYNYIDNNYLQSNVISNNFTTRDYIVNNYATKNEISNFYTKPSTGIPANDLADGVIPDTTIFAPKADPVFTGSISLERRESYPVGINSVAIGEEGIASGRSSLAEGDGATASGRASHAEGRATTASGNYSHAEGYGSTASGDYSHAGGRGTNATGGFSYTGGMYNILDSKDDWAEWQPNTFYPQNSHVKVTTEDSVSYYAALLSHNSKDSFLPLNSILWVRADGRSNYQELCLTNNYIEIIGNGVNSSRSNARALDWTGNEYLMGNLYVNCDKDSTSGEKVLTSKDLLMNKKITSYVYINLESMDIRHQKRNTIQELSITKEQLTQGPFFLEANGRQQLISGEVISYENNNWDFKSKQLGVDGIYIKPVLTIEYDNSLNQYTILFAGFYPETSPNGKNELVRLIIPVYSFVTLAENLYINASADFTNGEKVATETYVNAKVPDPPTTDGTYTLQVTVTNGVPTYSWV